MSRRVLVVDDDIRNIFSLTSVLESHDVEVLHAERGRDGILILEQTPGVDVALIDIMMPDMDGYETMQQIRKLPELADLPLEGGAVGPVPRDHERDVLHVRKRAQEHADGLLRPEPTGEREHRSVEAKVRTQLVPGRQRRHFGRWIGKHGDAIGVEAPAKRDCA